MNPKLYERIGRFKNTVKLENKDRVIHFGNLWAYPVWEQGVSLNAAARDYDLRTELLVNFQKKYNFDLYADNWTRNPMRIVDALGGGTFILKDDPFAVETLERDYIDPEVDYDMMINDVMHWLWTVLLPRKLPQLTEGNGLEMLKEAAYELVKFNEWNQEITRIFREELGTTSLFGSEVSYLAPWADQLVNDLRGMKGLMIDMRRRPEKLSEFLDAFGCFGYADAPREKGSNPEKFADFLMTSLADTFMNAKQFEKYYWPQMKACYEYVVEYDKILFNFLEGDTTRFYDYFKDYGSKHVVLYFEKNDVFEAKKIFEGTHAIGGGMTCHMLKNGTKQECVDHAKRLIEELNGDGGYIFGEDLMMSYPADADPENLKAVCDYVNTYAV